MVFNFLKRIFSKKRRTYVVAASDGAIEPSPDHPNFEEKHEEAQLLKASRLSPLMWRHIFPLSPAHPIDYEYEDSDGASSGSYPRSYSTSSAGYCSQSSGDNSTPRLGASSLGYNSDSAEIEMFSSKETSPLAVEVEVEVRTVRFRGCEYDHTPTISHNLYTPGTLPPKTPLRASFLRREMRKKTQQPSVSCHFEQMQIEESSYESKIFRSEPDLLATPHNTRNMFTPGTLPPKTPYRASFARQEMRKRPGKSEIYPVLDLEMISADHEESSTETKAVNSIWGTPVYSPASMNDILSESPTSPESPCSHFEEAFVRHYNTKLSLRRKPSAPVSGRVKQMILFFENDSVRVEIPRRLDQVPAEYMRSCPQMNGTQTPPRPSHGHTQSDHVRGITHSSDRCIRCPSYYRTTPNSRRSMG